VIHLDAGGNMVDFIMNDKCAAGTGRFLEMAARTLELGLTDMAVMTADPTRACAVNNTCVVFAETEIISLLAKRRASRDIVSGIYLAFAGRIGNMVKRLGVRPPMVFVGGVAKNRGLAQALAECLGQSFTPLEIDPQLTGALGAAALAMQTDANKGCETCR
jgi:predicted CoA-substrate-specific enzyme activase